MHKPLLLVGFYTLLLSACSPAPSPHQEQANSEPTESKGETPEFLKSVQALVSGKSSDAEALDISELGTIDINILLGEDSLISQEEQFRFESATLKLSEFEPIRGEDIIDIRDKFVLVLLRDSLSNALRVASISVSGQPIESVLIYDSIGNNQYTISRAFDAKKDIPFQYHAPTQEFVFVERRTDTDWTSAPTQGERVLTWEEPYTVKVLSNGEFSLISN